MGQQLSSGGDPQNDPNPEVAWWCKLLARIICIVAAVISVPLGISTCISLSPLCIVAGILQILFALVVLFFEAPCCCMWLDGTKPLANFAQNRTFFQKAIIFGIMAIVPVPMCFPTLGTLLGGGLILAGGVFYGLMGLGKKADREQMRANAMSGEDKIGLVQNDRLNNA